MFDALNTAVPNSRGRTAKPDPRAVGIVGSRDYPRPDLVETFVVSLKPGTIVVSGGAPGVDSIAESVARRIGLTLIVHPADWKGLGRKAGPIQNGLIVESSSRIVAFWNEANRGTLNTVLQAVQRGRETIIFGGDGREVCLDESLAAAERLRVTFKGM
jgi:hypothetical protein